MIVSKLLGRIIVSIIGLGFTFLNAFILEDSDLLSLIENTATVLILYTIFDMGSERIVMNETTADSFSATQVERHYNILHSNIVLMAPLLISLMFLFVEDYLQFTSAVLIALCATLLTPLKLAALKQSHDINWLTYEFLLSSIFVFTSLSMYLGLKITQANIVTSVLLLGVFVSQIRLWKMTLVFAI